MTILIVGWVDRAIELFAASYQFQLHSYMMGSGPLGVVRWGMWNY